MREKKRKGGGFFRGVSPWGTERLAVAVPVRLKPRVALALAYYLDTSPHLVTQIET